jgi:thymidylate synthase (FAD)
MHINLLQSGSIEVVIRAIRTCYDSMGKSDSVTVGGEFILGAHDKDLLCRIIDTNHLSTIEHLSYTFHIEGVSRGLLQELARHRIASMSCKSTRYTLGRVKSEESFTLFDCGGGKFEPEYEGFKRSEKYLVRSGDKVTDAAAYMALVNVQKNAIAGTPNDQLKYCLPEAMKTELIWTINARSLRNFMELRTSPRAHWEIRKMAETIKGLIPAEHLVLFGGILCENLD